jgi:amino acid adenylation domain-containing protein
MIPPRAAALTQRAATGGTEVQIRQVRRVQDSLVNSAAQFPGKEAVLASAGRSSYQELLDGSLGVAAALRRLGLQRGDRVAIFMENSLETALGIYGTWLAGGVIVVINPQTKADKLAFMLNDCEATLLLTEQLLASAFMPALDRVQGLRAALCKDLAPAGPWPDTLLDWARQLALPAAEMQDPGTIPTDLAALIYTSGSTGNPKGVMMTHQNMVFTLGSLVEYLRLEPADRIINFLPLAFDYGLYQLLMSVYLGATLVLEANFSFPAVILARVEEEQVTVFPGVPTVFATLVSLQKRSPRSFGSVRRITNTAAHLPDDFVAGLESMFPAALIFKMYGLTECKRVCYLEPELVSARPGSVGKAIPGTEVFLLSEEGQAVLPGETGVLHVRGPHVMQGYWRQPELSAHMLREGPVPGERVLCTHDFFRMDADGFLYFVGRNDDIIKTRGEKVSPTEVENALHRIPGVREAAVVGEPDDLLGEIVVAFIVLEPDAELTERDIRRLSLGQLESFMVPASVRFVSDLPKTATGKIRRKSLKEDAGTAGTVSAARAS